MSVPSTAKPSIPTSEQYAALDPIIFDPGRLPQSSGEAQTSTIHITLTTSAPKPTPTTASASDSTAISKSTSVLTKTVTLGSSTPSPHTPQFTQSTKPASSRLSNEHNVHTTVLSADPRGPYPFPGVYCGEPKTTLVTETSSERGSATGAPTSMTESGKTEGDGDGSCPYPGIKC